jgi:hypothetical protein
MTTYAAFGFDYAFAPRPSIAELLANGCQFVCRYLSGNRTTLGQGKNISIAEYQALVAAGIHVVLNWETDGTMVSFSQGVSAAMNANDCCQALGTPNAPVIFSADFDPTNNTMGILAYMRGVASVLGWARTGLYSGLQGIADYFNAGIGKWGWQAFAWSGGVWDGRALLEQYQNDVTLSDGSQVDRDRALSGSFGQADGIIVTVPVAPPDEENQMILPQGAGQQLPIRFPVFPSYLFLVADVGFNGGAPTSVRIALHTTGANWGVQTVTLTSAAPGVTIPLAGTNYDAASLDRLDDAAYPVGVSWR